MAILKWLHCFFDWMKLPMSDESKIGLLLGKWTEKPQSFSAFPITSHQPASSVYPNAFLTFAYQWLHITAEDAKGQTPEIRDAALDDAWTTMDKAREAIASRNVDDK